MKMEIDQIRILNILEEISRRDHTSQRELSKKLNISLGLVNSFVKRLAKKGYFKVTTLPKNRLKYIITPKGIAEKTRLTYEYFHFSIGLFKSTQKKIHRVFQNLLDQGAQNVVIFGTSDLAEIAVILMRLTSLKLVAVIDSDNSGKRFMGKTTLKPEELDLIQFDKMIIADLTQGFDKTDIAKVLKIKEDKLVAIQ